MAEAEATTVEVTERKATNSKFVVVVVVGKNIPFLAMVSCTSPMSLIEKPPYYRTNKGQC